MAPPGGSPPSRVAAPAKVTAGSFPGAPGNLLRAGDSIFRKRRDMLPVRTALPAPDSLADGEIVARVVAGERRLFELIMRRHNERIYRAVRSILRDETEAEDAMQQAYVDAFQHLGEFQGRARFSTWLTRIAVHEALARKRRQKPENAEDEAMANLPGPERNPEENAQDGEMQKVLVSAIDALPEHFRTVFVLRSVQGLSVEETAEALDLKEDT